MPQRGIRRVPYRVVAAYDEPLGLRRAGRRCHGQRGPVGVEERVAIAARRRQPFRRHWSQLKVLDREDLSAGLVHRAYARTVRSGGRKPDPQR